MADATAAPETAENNDEFTHEVAIEDAGPAKKRLTITIPAAEIDEKIETSFGTLGSEASIPGFRRGKAPRALLERRFGSAVKNETKNQLIADAYSQALEAHELRPVGSPEPVTSFDEIEVKPGEPLTFAVEVEIVPMFDLPELENIPVKKPVMDIEDQHITDEVDRLALRHGQALPIESDFAENDRFVGRLSVTREGEDEPFFVEENGVAVVPPDADGGKGQVVGLIIDDLGPRLKNAKLGETITIETIGPESHEREDLRGKKLTINLDVREAFKIEPASGEQLVEAFGMGTEDNLKEQLRLSLEHRRDQEQRTAMREQIHDYLTAQVDFELPEKSSEAQVSRTIERQRMELLYKGRDPEQVENTIAEARESSEGIIRDRLKLQFILFRLGDHFDVQVNEQEINGRVASMAAQHGVRPAKLKADLAKSGRLSELATQIREHKAVDRIIERAEVMDISAEDWNKEFGDKQTSSKKKTTKKKTTKKKTTKKTTAKS